MANEFVARNGLLALDDSKVSGSLNVTNGISITGSIVVSGSNGSGVFSQGGTLSDYVTGITTSGSYMVWRAPFSCSVVALYGYREGGGNAQINAQRTGSSGTALHSATNVVLSTDATWTAASSIQNTNYNRGDALKIIVSGSSNNQISVQVDFIKK